jgi:hypothetical protein
MRPVVLCARRLRSALLLTLVASILGCGDTKPQPPVSSASSAPAIAAPSASVAGPAPSASVSAAAPPVLPPGITSCEASGPHHGGFVPTAEKLVLALGVSDPDACLPEAIAGRAVRACVAQLGGNTAIKLSTDRYEGTPKGCEVSFAGASADGREWIVLRSVFREGSRFVGFTKVVELTNGGPKLYLDATGEDEPACPTEGGAAPPKQESAGPEGWSKLDLELKRFLCERAG